MTMEWFDGLEAREAGMCRVVQLGLVRLLANPSAIGKAAVSVSDAWKIAEKLLGDARVEFVSEPSDIDATMPELLKYKEPTGKLVTDAYLAAFAINSHKRFVTLDRGFRQFKGPEVEILSQS